MKAAVIDDKDVREVIERAFIMIKLMVDDKAKLNNPIKVVENGREVTLSTIGEKWSYLQRFKFGANSQPYYVILNGKGELMSGPYYYDESIEKFLAFLTKGLENFDKQ